MDTNKLSLRETDTKKVELYLLDMLRGTSSNPAMTAYAVSFVIVKSSQIDASDISTIDAFISSCCIGKDIELFLRDKLRNSWEYISKARSVFDPEMFKAFLLFDDITYGREFDDTPHSITSLSLRLLDIKNGDYVADYCTGKLSFICNSYLNAPDARYLGTEKNSDLACIALMRAEFLGNNITVRNEDTLACEFSETKYDKVFSDYPWGMKITGDMGGAAMRYINKYISSPRHTMSNEWIMNTMIINSLKEGGKGVVVTPAGPLFRGGAERDIRKHFVENGFIEAIIEMPSNMYEKTAISTLLIIFSFNNKSIRFINASEMCQKGRRFNVLSNENIDEIMRLYKNDSKLSKCVGIDKIELNDYNLQPSRYFEEKPIVKNGVPFGDVIKSITRGAQLTAAKLDELISDKPTEYQYLTLADIQDGEIKDELSYISGIDDNLQKYCLKNNDLLISKNGSPIKVAIADAEIDHSILVNGNLYIIELDKKKIDPYYLKAYLDSESGAASVKQICFGAVVPNIPLEALKKMVIPLPPLEQQHKIATDYTKALDGIKKLRSQLKSAEEKLKNIYNEHSEP